MVQVKTQVISTYRSQNQTFTVVGCFNGKMTLILNRYSFLFLLIFCLVFSAQARLCTSNGSGNWNANSTWSCGSPPTCNDSVVILVTHSVTISANENYGCSGKIAIALYGVLRFNNGRKISLPCNSRIYLFSGSQILVNGGGGSNTIEICGTTYWSSSGGTLSGPSCLPSTQPGCSNVLPIELLGFSAIICNGFLCLKWSTAVEKNNSYFKVQKTINGADYITLSSVDTKAPRGNSNGVLEYSYIDISPEVGQNYYRLRQVDIDGSYSDSPIINLDFSLDNNSDFDMFPNPGNEKFTVKSKSIQSIIEVKIFNGQGALIKETTTENNRELTFDIHSSGLYYVVINNNYRAVKKLIAN